MIGKLRYRITIEGETTTAGEGGVLITTWQPVATVWAHIAPLRGQELFEAMQLVNKVSHRVMVRYQKALESIVSGHRIRWQDGLHERVFNITASLADNRHEWIILECQEVIQ
ncbi:MAG: phage head closure protein [Firmicutes bacterium]|nr:phage head closure protein [Bacillota bacterium]